MGSGNVKGRVAESDLCLTIGISDAIPKLIAYRLIEPVSAAPSFSWADS